MSASSFRTCTTGALFAAALLTASALIAAPNVSAATPARGVAWPYYENTTATAFENGSSWVYNWELYAPTGGSIGDMEFTPMVRTASDVDYVADYQTVKDAAWLLGFNEPDMSYSAGGSAMNASYAAELWKKYIAPLRSDTRKLVAPAVSSSGSTGEGPSWLAEFIQACDGCIFDAYAYHPYASNRWGVSALIDNFLQLNYTPVWITEFNVYTADEGGPDFIKYMIDYFNTKTTNQIGRYSMISRVNQDSATTLDLQYVNGSLTPAGETYNTYSVSAHASTSTSTTAASSTSTNSPEVAESASASSSSLKGTSSSLKTSSKTSSMTTSTKKSSTTSSKTTSTTSSKKTSSSSSKKTSSTSSKKTTSTSSKKTTSTSSKKTTSTSSKKTSSTSSKKTSSTKKSSSSTKKASSTKTSSKVSSTSTKKA